MQTRTIEIDIDVHKLIEAERASFAETENDALRRLLTLPPTPRAAAVGSESGRPWVSKGVTLPHGTLLRMNYNGLEYRGTIADGSWLVGDERFSSPSAAACAVAVTKDGKSPALNGWNYWYVKEPSQSRWRLIAELRPTS